MPKTDSSLWASIAGLRARGMNEMMSGSLAALPGGHPAAELMRASYAAWHLCMSLLACRDGATDELIAEVRDALAEAVLITVLAAQMAETIRTETAQRPEVPG